MNIRLNGKWTSIGSDLTIGGLIRDKALDPKTVVVEHNKTIVPTELLDQVKLQDNDTLEVLRFVGGG